MKRVLEMRLEILNALYKSFGYDKEKAIREYETFMNHRPDFTIEEAHQCIIGCIPKTVDLPYFMR